MIQSETERTKWNDRRFSFCKLPIAFPKVYRFSQSWAFRFQLFDKKEIKNISVIDATSHIGGNTIPLGLNGFNVIAIEINENIYNLLNMNIKLYKLKIKTICEDFINFIPKIKHDVVFIDAPWGGTSYKKIDKLDLYLSNINLVDITNKLKNKTKVIILKVPFNYNLQSFIKKNNFSRILQLFSLERYYLIILIDESLKLLNFTL